MKAIEIRNFDEVGAEVDYSTILSRHQDAARIELFSKEQIIKLNIRFDEIFHRCEDQEWSNFKLFLQEKNIPITINKWWQFWER